MIKNKEKRSNGPTRVVVYARVSTDHEDQRNSLEAQKRFFQSIIDEDPTLIFVGLYYDEGLSGTSRKKRKDFNRMIENAHKDEYDLIYTKEVSRFARNTVDTLTVTRELQKLNVGVVFVEDRINTLDKDGESRLTNLASMAQEESRKTSDRVRWGMRRRMEKGVVFGNSIFGYTLKNGKLTVNEEESKIINIIFDLYLSGMGIGKIGKILEEKGILSPNKQKNWSSKTIKYILENEKYVGDLKQLKSITTDFLEHTKVENDGNIEPFIMQENHHDIIISKEIFCLVQAEIKRRSKILEDNSKYSSKYAFSSKIICGQCGATYHRRQWHKKSEKVNIAWQCKENIKHGLRKCTECGDIRGCNNKGVHEEFLKQVFLMELNQLIENKEDVLNELKLVIKESLEECQESEINKRSLEKELQRINNKRLRLIELFTDGEINKELFTSSQESYLTQIATLKNSIFELEAQINNATSLEENIITINTILSKIFEFNSKEIFSDDVCKEILDKIIINNRNDIQFFFNFNSVKSTLSVPVLSLQQE